MSIKVRLDLIAFVYDTVLEGNEFMNMWQV